MMGKTPDWEAETIAGFQAIGASRIQEAAGHWIRAADLLAVESPPDPRSGTARSNAGVAHLLLGQRRAADQAFQAAEQFWIDLAEGIPTLDVPLVGTSSSFHFRLASGNVTSFTEARRKRYARLCDAALAITRFNRLFTRTDLPSRAEIETGRQALASLLADALGAQAPEIRLLTSTADDDWAPAYAEKIADFKARRPSMSEALSMDCHHLEVAFALTALFSPGLLPDEANSNDHEYADQTSRHKAP